MLFRQDRMTGEDRLKALFAYAKPDHVPIGALGGLVEFSALNFGYARAINYNDPEKSFFSQIWTTAQYGWDLIPFRMGLSLLGALDFGGETHLPESPYQQGISVQSYPVATEEDIGRLKLPDRKTAGRIPQEKEFAGLQAKNGISVWFSFHSPFTMGAHLCGLPQFCRWMIRKPGLCHELMKLTLAHILNVLEDWVETFGAGELIVYMASPSESNQLISPKQFEEFALPYQILFHERLRAMGIKRFMFHICGDQNLNLPRLAELSPWPHPSILSFGHEVDLDVAAQFFPEDIIYGNIEPATIQAGSPQKVYDVSREIIEKGKRAPGGFILAPACGLPPASPPANAFAITRAVNDFGWYE